MRCSYLTRCINSKLISFDNIFICKTCDSIFEKPEKLSNKEVLYKCCKKRLINNKYNKPICNSCKRICVINI